MLDTGMAMTANPAPPSNRFVYVPSGVFQMGRPYAWPAAWAQERTNEVPVHNVYLSAYYIGKYPITNYEFAEFLSWIYQHWTLHPEDIYINPQGMLVYIAAHGAMLLDDFDAINFQLVGGRFVAKFPNLPVTQVTWNAAALYCNWRNELEGLPAVYDVSTWELYSPLRSGYRLPTEAEWERAAAWDGARHWRYGNMSDSISCAQGNFYSPLIDGEGSILPGTWCYGQKLPVGWFNGINPLTPGSSSTTALSRSPVGAFDMSGYPAEWCHDRYRDDQYSVNALSGVVSNPTGPPTGDRRVLRGDVSIPAPFEWFSPTTAYRASGPTGWGPFDNIGFRVVFSP